MNGHFFIPSVVLDLDNKLVFEESSIKDNGGGSRSFVGYARDGLARC